MWTVRDFIKNKTFQVEKPIDAYKACKEIYQKYGDYEENFKLLVHSFCDSHKAFGVKNLCWAEEEKHLND